MPIATSRRDAARERMSPPLRHGRYIPAMTGALSAAMIAQAPKVLLHDHLDGGLRPQTVIDLAESAGYRNLLCQDAADLARWFSEAAYSGSLERYLETFQHTVGVTQSAEALARVSRELSLIHI